MKSLQLTIGFLSFLMLLCKSQLSSSSPAGVRPDGTKLFSAEDPIIDEEVFAAEVDKLHPRIKQSNLRKKINVSEIAAKEKGNFTGDEDMSKAGGRKLHPRIKLNTGAKEIFEDSIENEREDPIIDDVLPLTESRKLHPRVIATKNQKRVNISEDSIEEGQKDIVDDVTVGNNKKPHPSIKPTKVFNKTTSESTIEKKNTDFSDEKTSGSTTHVHNHPINQNHSEGKVNKSEASENGRKELLFKHDHLTDLLFDSTQFDNTSPITNDFESSDENNSDLRVGPMARASFNIEENQNDFQARSDTNLSEEVARQETSSSGDQVDRSFEIDAAGMLDSFNQNGEGSDEEVETVSTEEKQDNKGLLHFLRSLFGL